MNDQMGYSKLFDWLKELMQWFYQVMPIGRQTGRQPRSSNAPGLSAAALAPGRPRQDPMTSFCSGTPVYANT